MQVKKLEPAVPLNSWGVGLCCAFPTCPDLRVVHQETGTVDSAYTPSSLLPLQAQTSASSLLTSPPSPECPRTYPGPPPYHAPAADGPYCFCMTGPNAVSLPQLCPERCRLPRHTRFRRAPPGCKRVGHRVTPTDPYQTYLTARLV